MNEVLKTISQRSSIRAYTAKKLTDAEIKALITAGLQAPTARNMQEVHISVIDGDNPILKEIDTQCKLTMLKAAPDDETKAKIESNPNNFYYNAPTVLILSADKDFKWSKLDAGITVQNIALAAQSMKLGSLIIGIIDDVMRGEKKDYFAKLLKFPDNHEFAIAVAVGHRATEKKPHEIDFDSKVTVSVTEEQKEKIKSELGKAITTLHKTETYLMVGIEDDYDLWMAGNKLDKGAYVSVSLFGNASASDYDNMTAKICEIYEQELGIPSNAIYVTYHPIADWGWNGHNF